MAPRVPVSPSTLEWAADHGGLDPSALHERFPSWDEWLAGERQPTLNQLEKFADAAGVPFGYLLLDDPPEVELPIPDFREGFQGAVREPSSDLLAVLNQSIRRQDWYRGYAEDNALPDLDFVGASAEQDPEAVAAQMRSALGFEVSTRARSWNDVRKQLIQSFERLGGLTVVTSMVENNTHRLLDPAEFRGFALVDATAPLVFVNAHQTLNGQIFTLAHEFAHVWHGTSGISLEEPGWEPQSEVERWCNAVASEFLVPGRDLERRFPNVARRNLTDQLDELARVYRCGTLVVLQAIRRRRLRTFADFDAVYLAERRQLESLTPEGPSEGGGNFYYNQPFRIGERLSRTVIADTLEGRTTFSEALRLTSLKSLSAFVKYADHLGIR